MELVRLLLMGYMPEIRKDLLSKLITQSYIKENLLLLAVFWKLGNTYVKSKIEHTIEKIPSTYLYLYL